MELRWLGGRSVRLSGQKARVLMDPNPPVGSAGAESAGLVTYSLAAPERCGRRPDGSFVIAGAGEYEVDEIFVIGVTGGAADGSNTLYNVNIDGVNVVHPGAAAQRLSQAQVEELGAVDVRARVVTLNGLSGHADRSELLAWAGRLKPAPRETFLVHGEPDAAFALADSLRGQLGFGSVHVPEMGQRFTF